MLITITNLMNLLVADCGAQQSPYESLGWTEAQTQEDFSVVTSV